MSKRSFETSTEINAPQGAVWAVLSDVEAWPSWTPTMTSIQGLGNTHLTVGSRFEIKQPGLPKAIFTVDRCDEGASFAWSTRSGGVQTSADHVLASLTEQRTQVKLVLTLEGALAPVVWLISSRKIRRFVETEARSLKAAVEAR